MKEEQWTHSHNWHLMQITVVGLVFAIVTDRWQSPGCSEDARKRKTEEEVLWQIWRDEGDRRFRLHFLSRRGKQSLMTQMNKEQWDKSMGQELEMIKISWWEPRTAKVSKVPLLLESVNIYACPVYIYIYSFACLPAAWDPVFDYPAFPIQLALGLCVYNPFQT